MTIGNAATSAAQPPVHWELNPDHMIPAQTRTVSTEKNA